uniref:Amidase domain-containing protein n=1 Tax=Sphenodon punctatus TaxID=8508 RepID=A0A8D0GYJ4_SPHPU
RWSVAAVSRGGLTVRARGKTRGHWERQHGKGGASGVGLNTTILMAMSVCESTCFSAKSNKLSFLPPKGHLSTCGLARFLNTPAEEDSVLVKVLKRQGAIPFAITNVPQSLFNYDCSNSVFGRTVNPLNPKKSPGGSSGGEAALIAGGGAILGFGSDIGGSIRLPSSFCGIFTGAVGPMARDVDSLALCMQALLCEDMFRLDPTVPPMPFNDEVYSSSAPLRIGYYETDGYFLLPPCMRRALHETRRHLQQAGHTVCMFESGDLLFRAFLVHMAPITTLFSRRVCVAKDIVDPGLKPQVNCYRIPLLMKRILAFLIRPLVSLNILLPLGSARELCKSLRSVFLAFPNQAYRVEFTAEWRKLSLDVVLCPVLGPAFDVGYPGKLLAAVSSTMLYNVLNFPAGVVPVSTVMEADEEELEQHRGHHGDPWDKKLRQAVKGAVGLPVAVQCVALPWQEELCLRFMKEVETLSSKGRGKMRLS